MAVRMVDELPAGIIPGRRRSKYADLIAAIEQNQESLLKGKQIEYSVPGLRARQLNNRLNSYLRYTRPNMRLPENVEIVKSVDDSYVYITLELKEEKED